MSQKIHILHIITRLDPGGSSTNTLETVRRLDKNRFEVDLIAGRTNDPAGGVGEFIRRHGISCVFMDDLVRDIHLWRDLKAFFELYGLIRRGGYDIVHTHSSKAGILGRWAARCAGVKYIVHTPHGHVFYGYFSSLTTRVFVLIERITALITTKLIALTHKGIREHLEFKVGRSDKWSAVPSGIDMTMFVHDPADRAAIRAEYGIKSDDLLFVSVTRLDPIKGNHVLVEAFASVVSDLPSVRLLIVGSGSEEAKLEARVKELGLEGKIIFAGYRPRVESFLSAADVFVLASLNEGMGRSVVEAMAAGLPVIASSTGGVPELVDDDVEGYLVEPGDSQSLALAMWRMADDRETRIRMAAAARSKAGERFSIETMVRTIEEVYEKF